MITKLIKALREDKNYYYSWQSNIAMAFMDNFERYKVKKKYLIHQDLHTIANNSAKDFLDLLIKDNTWDEK